MRGIAKICVFAFAAFCVLATPAKAHTVWVMAEKATQGEDGVFILGYGHDFPLPEPIAPERANIFKTPEIIAPNGDRMTLKPTEESYLFATGAPLARGTYLVLGEYQPTIWTTTRSEGAKVMPKNEAKGSVVSSYRFSTYAKGIVNVGNATATEQMTKPVGTILEIVPQANPAAVKVGDKMRVQVLFEGKPLSGTWVYGLTEGYALGLHDAKAFANRTDRNGFIEFVPWKSGMWQLEVNHRVDLEDQTTHDYDEISAKLSFEIK